MNGTDKWRERHFLWLLVVAYLLLGVQYALATPPLEASDEYKHYPVVQFIETERRLPVLDVDDPGRWLQEGAQPPLYYLLMAGLTAWIDTSDLPQVHQVNKYAFVGDPNQIGNKNLLLHQPAQEAFPWEGSVLAIYLIRAASLLLGIGTILLTVRLGSLLFSWRTGLLAGALTAFNPMFLFVSAAVNNDSLALLLGHAALYFLVRLWRERPDPGQRPRLYLALGLLLGAGLLTKLSMGGLLAIAGLMFLWISWERREWSFFFLGGGMVAAVALALAAPWFVRNAFLYGDPTGLEAFVAVQGTREAPLTLQGWWEETGTLYRSFWGLFGGVNVAAPEIFYTLANLLALAAGLGFVARYWRRWHDAPRGAWLLLAWPLVLFLLLVRWNIISPAFQGRLLFPGLGALNIVGSVGLRWWAARIGRPRLVAAVASLAFVAATLIPWLVIRPAYAHPAPVGSVPPEARFGPIHFHLPDGDLRLVGVDLAQGQSVSPAAEPVKLTLYWQAEESLEQDYLTAVHLLGRDRQPVGGVNRHPANGMVPTSEWQAGEIWQDRYHIIVNEDAEAPARLRLRVGVYDPRREVDAPMSGPAGQELEELVVGRARLAGGELPQEPGTIVDAMLDEAIRMYGYDLEPGAAAPGTTLRLALYWEATAHLARNYTVFVHLLDEEGELLATADSPPVSGDYPTSLWQAGDRVKDVHELHLPADLAAGVYQIAVGMYHPASGARLPLSIDGVRQPTDAFMVDEVVVE